MIPSFEKNSNNDIGLGQQILSPEQVVENGENELEIAVNNQNEDRKLSHVHEYGETAMTRYIEADDLKQFPIFSEPPKSPAKLITRINFLDIIKRKKSSKNGYPGMPSHSMEVEYSPSTSTYNPFLESRGLSAAIDKTYNAMLQSKVTSSRMHSKTSLQARIYNFLERPTGWKCFIYHFTV